MTALESFEKKFWVNCKSIDELKFQPIPEKLQCDTKNKSVCTTVFDIFFEEQKYSDSVKRTTSSIGNLKKKLEITQT
jgi:predicted  nucleic acid-binding Zn-ribbon protein